MADRIDLTATSLTLVDVDGNARIILGCSADGEAVIRLSDAEGRPRVKIAVKGTEFGEPLMTLFDGDGNGHISLFLDAHGQPNIIGADRLGLTVFDAKDG